VKDQSKIKPLAPRLSDAFTLIELLVVIAIISILAAMLLPSLQKARDKAKMAVCVSNQKQMTMAALLYADEHLDQLPRGDDYTIPRDGDWVRSILPYLNIKSIRTLKCPAAQLADPVVNLSIGVQYPNIFGHEWPDGTPGSSTIPSKFLRELPPGTLLTGDNDTNTGLILGPAWNTFLVDTDGDGRKDSYTIFRIYNDLHFRHGGLAVAGCADGSVRLVSLKQWLDNDQKLWGP